MEDRIQDKNRLNDFVNKYAGNDSNLKALIFLGCFNNVSDFTIDDIFSNSSDETVIQAKLFASLIGEDYENIFSISDIKNQIIQNNKESVGEFIEVLINDKFNSILEKLSSENIDIKEIKKISHSQINNEKLLNKYGDILVMIAEVLSDLHIEINSIKPFIVDNKEVNVENSNNFDTAELTNNIIKSIDEYFRNIHQDIIQNQNDLLKEILNNKSTSFFKKKYSQFNFPDTFISSSKDVVEEMKEKISLEEENSNSLDKYNDCLEKIKNTNYANYMKFSYDVMELSDLDVFDKNQKEAILKALEENIDKDAVLMIANPNKDADFMYRFIKFNKSNKDKFKQREKIQINNRNLYKED